MLSQEVCRELGDCRVTALTVTPYLAGQGWPGGRATGTGAWQQRGDAGDLGTAARGWPILSARGPWGQEEAAKSLEIHSSAFPKIHPQAELAEPVPAPAKGNSFRGTAKSSIPAR